MAGDAVGAFPKVVTRDDAQLWAWKAHNRVNRDLAESEKKGEGTGSGDRRIPKRNGRTRTRAPLAARRLLAWAKTAKPFDGTKTRP